MDANFFTAANPVGGSHVVNFPNQKLVHSFERIVQEDPAFAGCL